MKKKSVILIILVGLVLLSSCSSKEGEELNLYPAYEWKDNVRTWGYIDRRGEFIVKPKYTTAGEIIDGLGLVEKDGLFGLINSQGREVLKAEFKKISSYDQGYIVAQKDEKLGIYDYEAREIPLSKNYYSIGSPRDDLFLVASKDREGRIKYGYVDTRGREVIRPKFDMAYDFYQGRALVKDGQTYKLIKKSGRVKKELDIKALRPSNQEGYYIFTEDHESYGLLDHKGELVLKPVYSSIEKIDGDMVIAGLDQNGEELFGLFNLEGERLLEAKYKDIRILSDTRLALSEGMDQYGRKLYKLADHKGKYINKAEYLNLGGRLDSYQADYLSATDGKTSFLIDENGVKQSIIELPGIGYLELYKDIIKAVIEDDFKYYNSREEIVWEAQNFYRLDENREVFEKEYKDQESILIKYPVFLGYEDREIQRSINSKLEKEFLYFKGQRITEARHKYFRSNYDIETRDGLVKIVKNSKYLDQDRENFSKRPYYIDGETGDFYRLKDLFKPSSNYRELLGKRLGQELELKYGQANHYGLARIEEDQAFEIKDGNLILYLEYREDKDRPLGYEEIEISLDSLGNILDKESKLVKNVIGK